MAAAEDNEEATLAQCIADPAYKEEGGLSSLGGGVTVLQMSLTPQHLPAGASSPSSNSGVRSFTTPPMNEDEFRDMLARMSPQESSMSLPPLPPLSPTASEEETLR